MDALKTVVVFPLVSLIQYSRFTVSSIIILPFLLVNYITLGKKSLSNFAIYSQAKRIPFFGKWFFSGLVVFFAPYTASISCYVEELNESKGAMIILYDYPWLRNPYQSIHAIALANLGEYTSGILLVSQLQQRKDLRGVPIKITTEYYKKARGTLKATSTATNLSNITVKSDVTVITDVYDRKAVLVSRTFVTWTIEPKAASSSSSSSSSSSNNNSSSGGGSNSSSNDTKKKKK